MASLTTRLLVLRNLRAQWLLVASAFIGILFAAALACATPLYIKSLERLALNLEIDELGHFESKILAFSFHSSIDSDSVTETDLAFERALNSNIGELYPKYYRYLTGLDYYAGLPSNPLTSLPNSASRAYLKHLDGFEENILPITGNLPQALPIMGTDGPMIEVVVGELAANRAGLSVGDVITLTPDPSLRTTIEARLVGIVKAAAPKSDFWVPSPAFFLDPEPIDPEDPGDGIYNPILPPTPLFTTRDSLVEAVSTAYPGTFATSIWFIHTDTKALKTLSGAEVRSRIEDLEDDLISAMPGRAEISTGILRMLSQYEARSFLARVPFLLLQTSLIAVIFFFLTMVASQFMKGREAHVALLKTRGSGKLHLWRMYVFEGFALTLAAAFLAPFVAMGIVAASGKLPHMESLSQGNFLPLVLHVMPFVLSLIASLTCVLIFVASLVIGSKSNVLSHGSRTSRPPEASFIYRFYIDVGVLVIGGVIFWELYTRGHLIAGGLFKSAELNEILLLSPTIFMLAVGLLFLRIFPMVVRYVSGESDSLIDLLVALSVLSLVSGTIYKDLVAGSTWGWLSSVALVSTIAISYWLTAGANLRRYRFIGWVSQAALVYWFVQQRPLAEAELLILPMITLIVIVPLQLLFAMMQRLSTLAPVWLSLCLLNFSRNQRQYNWLILMLIMITGISVFAATVGDTLEKNSSDLVSYEVAGDLRLSNIDPMLAKNQHADGVVSLIEGVSGVTMTSLAYRQDRFDSANSVEILGLSPTDFAQFSWYRNDFSDKPLSSVMRALRPTRQTAPLKLPDNAMFVGIYAKLAETISGLSVRLVVQDAEGVFHAVWINSPGNSFSPASFDNASKVDLPSEWHLLRGKIPRSFPRPLHVVSLQILEPQNRNRNLTPGTLFVDDIHTMDSINGQIEVVEDFESRLPLTAMLTSPQASDTFYSYEGDAFTGNRSGMYKFGKISTKGVRGIYVSPTGTSLPIVVSETFSSHFKVRVGDQVALQVAGRIVPTKISEVTKHFPTMRSGYHGFVLTDFEGLLAHVNLIDPISPVLPNEIFLTSSSLAEAELITALSPITSRGGTIRNRYEMLRSLRQDPLRAAGWTSVALLTACVALVIAAISYATHLLAYTRGVHQEVGALRPLGFTRLQAFGLFCFQNFLIALMGLGVGTWAGFQMSNLLITAVVAKPAGVMLPGHPLTTDWFVMGLTYSGLITIFVITLVITNRRVGAIDLPTISRVQA